MHKRKYLGADSDDRVRSLAYLWDRAAHDAPRHTNFEEVPECVGFKPSFVDCILSSKVSPLPYLSMLP